MKTKLTILALGLAITATGALAQTNSNSQDTTVAPAPVAPATGSDSTMSTGSTSQASVSPLTQDFIIKSMAGNMFEIESSKLAQQSAQSPAVKAFAQKMIDEHTAAMQKMQQQVQQLGVQIPQAQTLDQTQQQALDQLKSADQGAAFDQAYIKAQVQAHEDALKLTQDYAQSGEVPELKQNAQQMAPEIQSHLQEIQGLEQSGSSTSG